jgi:5-methylcytosine-specific restriction endonuclease McrA
MSRPPGYYLWQELRQRVIDTYGTTCLCCGKTPELKEDIHIDHIIPQSKAPELKHNFNNLQVLCNKCNIKKSNHHSTDYRPEKFKKKYPLPKEKKPKPLYEENILSLEEIEEKFILWKRRLDLRDLNVFYLHKQ